MLDSVTARATALRRNRRGGAAGWVALIIVVVLAYLAWKAGWFAFAGFHP